MDGIKILDKNCNDLETALDCLFNRALRKIRLTLMLPTELSNLLWAHVYGLLSRPHLLPEIMYNLQQPNPMFSLRQWLLLQQSPFDLRNIKLMPSTNLHWLQK